MSTHTCLRGILLMIVTLLAGLTWAGQPSTSPPNWDQGDLSGHWTCPTPTGTTGDWFPVSGSNLTASITTSGGPVLVSITLSWVGYDPGSAVWLSATIDGQRQPERLDWQTCCGGVVDTVTFSRIYALGPDTYTFGAAMSCQNRLEVVQGWLTVYELPAVRR